LQLLLLVWGLLLLLMMVVVLLLSTQRHGERVASSYESHRKALIHGSSDSRG